MKQCRTSSSFRFLWFLFVLLIRAVASERDASSSSSSLRFVALGDWGGNEARANLPHPFTSVAQRATAKALAKHVGKTQPQFLLSLGDNFYQSGVQSVDDPRFNATFESVYGDAALAALPWYLVAGNHDHLGSIAAQLAYSQRSPRWHFPSEFYVERFAFGRSSLAVIFLDGTLFQAQWMRRPFAFVNQKYGDMLRSFEQLDWLNRTLAATRDADWLIVVCHMPLMSVAEYAGHPMMIAHLMPLLEQHDVAVYLSGHTHTLQHLRHNRVNYVVSGCGAAANINRWNWFNVPAGSLRFCYPRVREQQQADFTRQTDGGFASFTLHNATTASLRFIDSASSTLYATTIANPRRR
jgi:tartrate-resistant acid phosphatase type 5